MSIGQIKRAVQRKAFIKIKAIDRNGESYTIETNYDSNWLLCRCVQHEYDHLNGRLFIDLLEPAAKEDFLTEYRLSL